MGDLGWEFLPPREALTPEDGAEWDAILVFAPAVPREAVEGAERLKLVARLGVGFDRVDVAGCTRNGVLVSVTPDGVRRPMASAAMAFLLALAHQLPQKDRQLRSSGWNRFAEGGTALGGRTLGLIGVGNLGRDLVRLVEPWEMRVLAHDPYTVDAPVELVPLEELLRESDYVVVLCPLNDETRGLLNAERLAWMKPSAFLVNVARGPIVDQRALAEALREGRLAGAGLDVFEQEPIAPDDPLLELENVILTPHAAGLTDELRRETGRSAARAVRAVADGRVPEFVINREALAHPRLAGLR